MSFALKAEGEVKRTQLCKLKLIRLVVQRPSRSFPPAEIFRRLSVLKAGGARKKEINFAKFKFNIRLEIERNLLKTQELKWKHFYVRLRICWRESL